MSSGWRDRVAGLFDSKKQRYDYTALPEDPYDREEETQSRVSTPWADRRNLAIRFAGAALILAVVGVFVVSFTQIDEEQQTCDYVHSGFQCKPVISHKWGQYSPFYSVPSDISTDIPAGCEVTFAQILSRHGARDPTGHKSVAYAELIDHIQASVTEYGHHYEFLKDYEYTLGSDELTTFGQQQLVNSGIKFYERYENLARNFSPFVRSAGQKRVVDSAVNWTQGFHQARLADKHAVESPDPYPYSLLLLPEVQGFNNTLSPSTCPAFHGGGDDSYGPKEVWADIFLPPITERVNQNLIGANLTNADIIYLMDICPFETVAKTDGRLSSICSLFREDEWDSYDYYQTLGKWYGYTNGNPLGPTQGVGFVNELIARLTNQPVNDTTTTNSTLDGSDETFPLNAMLYADFSHDNDMSGVFGALGLYNATLPLSNSTKASPLKSRGYAASWVVPFAARMFVEKMRCEGIDEEMVRVLINDRVIPLQNCDVDAQGRCSLSEFVESLGFARQGGHWDMCDE
ncbi:histidine phosphatase superfamily [Xylaria sp. CBS 124048]|nr:histidine phosphatase superfamily [Xylaria sp. CBS 124048]